ncbi:hypothetical protein DL1_02050 [Thioclava dalianensis]|uniref:Sulfotransferase family protein n=1 Tax=Thioclava dalianensis TaxID=1185766 RepID=A0A074TDV2_9RHOB|nr:hypothetical protein [Thioclava dalianensis]KEP69869.1 hypothetical protein DL1_02050 [Thioclava dalianensis]SFM87111.1 hypothetical protein SAMN05216224_101689 [Thioclava dalianensis]
MRVIVHPGLHKTGTSTLQVSLRAARDQFPDWHIALPEDIPGLSRAAAYFSREGDPLQIGYFQSAVAEWLDGLEPRPDRAPLRGIVISNERMAGVMPGAAPHVTGYHAAPALLGAMAQVLRAHFGAKLDLHVMLAIRARPGWLDSLHWQLVRTEGLAEPGTAFRKRMAGFDIAPTLGAIRAAIAPAQLHVPRQEEMAGLAQGPLTPLFDLMELPPERRAKVALSKPQNDRPRHVDCAALCDALAAINARGLAPDEAEAQRRELLRAAWRENARHEKALKDDR